MIVNDVHISGEGFHLVVPTTELHQARTLTEQLFVLRNAKSTEAFAMFDGDECLVGFCIPSLVRSVIIVPRTYDATLDLTKEHVRLLRAQIAFYEDQKRQGY